MLIFLLWHIFKAYTLAISSALVESFQSLLFGLQYINDAQVYAAVLREYRSATTPTVVVRCDRALKASGILLLAAYYYNDKPCANKVLCTNTRSL